MANVLPRPPAALPKVRRYGLRPAVAGTTEVRFVKRINNSRLRREVDGSKQRDCYCLFALLVVVFVCGFAYGWQHFQCVRLGYEIQELKDQRSALQQFNRQLRLEEASLADPQRIDALAQSEGLTAPTPRQVIQVGPAAQPESQAEFAGNVLQPAPAAAVPVPESHRSSKAQ